MSARDIFGRFLYMKKNSSLRIRKITYLAILVALEVVLNRFCSINTMGLKIGFSFVPIIIAASLFGPLSAGIVYALADLTGAILFPIGTYHPGFTVCAAAMGLVYGLFLYIPKNGERGFFIRWKKVRLFPNVIIPALINNLVFGLIINTYWVSMLYGSKSYYGWFVYRLAEYAVLIPVTVVLTPAVLRLTSELSKIILGKGRK